ncbi:MAG: tetratricopeptide repeat protein [Sandaracinaceae bacterium]|nr:tetratricopeptide repeat protein [Sandaracinaceae bacterium]
MTPATHSALGLALVLTVVAPAAAQTESTYEGEARALFDAGVSAYEGGRFEEALQYFQRSYELSGRAELLNNIGTAAERARQDRLALRSYEAFLREVPPSEVTAAARARAQTRVSELRERLAQEDQAPPGPAQEHNAATPVSASGTGTAPVDDGGGGDAAPWVLVGVGAAVAVVGGIVLAVGLVDRATVEDPAEGAMWTEATQQAYDRAPALLTSGVVMLPVGVALAAVGVVWGVVASSDGASTVSLRVGPGTLGFEGTFE